MVSLRNKRRRGPSGTITDGDNREQFSGKTDSLASPTTFWGDSTKESNQMQSTSPSLPLAEKEKIQSSELSANDVSWLVLASCNNERIQFGPFFTQDEAKHVFSRFAFVTGLRNEKFGNLNDAEKSELSSLHWADALVSEKGRLASMGLASAQSIVAPVASSAPQELSDTPVVKLDDDFEPATTSSELLLQPKGNREWQQQRKLEQGAARASGLLRGVYQKNSRWQASIKIRSKQVHLGTVNTLKEAVALYDRAAFIVGREPNFVLEEEERRKLASVSWDKFLEDTRKAVAERNQHRKRH